MTNTSFRIVGILALLFWSTRPALGQSLFGPRVDRYGDALPEGAIVRLGTLRLTHLGGIETVAISPDGKIAASGVSNGKEIDLGEHAVPETKGVRVTEATIRLWDTKTGELLRQFSTPAVPVTHIHFAADGKAFFAGCGKFLCCWETVTGKKVWQREAINGERFAYSGLHLDAILQMGDTLVSLHSGTISCPVEKNGGTSTFYHRQRVLRFWNAKTGAPLPLPKSLESTVSTETRIPILLHEVALTPDLKRVAIAVSEGDPLPRDRSDLGFPGGKWKYPNSRVELIDLQTGKVLRSFPNPDGEFGKLAISADGSKVAALIDKTIETPYKKDGVTGIKIDTRKDLWFANSADGKKQLLAKDLSSIRNLVFVGTDRLAANDAESKITVWRLDTCARVEKHGIRPERFHPACAAGVAVESWQNTVRLIDAESGKAHLVLEGHRSAPALRFAIHARDKLISRDDDLAIFWDARSWKPTKSVSLPKSRNGFSWWSSRRDEMFDQTICVEKGLHLRKGERSLEIRDITTGKTLRHIDDDGEYMDYRFSPAGNRLMCQEDGSFGFFDVRTGKQLAKAVGESRREFYMWYPNPEISTHGKYFAKSATKERAAIELYEVDTGKLLRKLTPNFVDAKSSNILKFKFSADERLVFGEVRVAEEVEHGISRERVSVCIWNAESGEVLQDMVLNPAAYVFRRGWFNQSLVSVMAVSHDHRLVALARTYDHNFVARVESTPIEIWEVASGMKRGEFTGHGPIADLAFSPDNRYLASSSDDTTILVWDLQRPLNHLKRRARLTEKELDDCWQTLFERDAVQADAAIWNLIDCPDDSLPYLEKNLRPAPIPDVARVRRLLADLRSDDFKTRAGADNELSKYGELILTQLNLALKENDTLESRRRIESLAKKAKAGSEPFGSMQRVGEWRALDIAEKIGNSRAINYLRALANGAPDAQLTIAAKAALERAVGKSKVMR